LVIDLAGWQDQPEHEVLFLQAIEETSKNKVKAKLNINHSQVGVHNGCPQVAVEHNCSTESLRKWLNLSKKTHQTKRA